MSDMEREQFESEPYFENAVRLRHWDDIAKDRDKTTKQLREFEAYIEASLA